MTTPTTNLLEWIDERIKEISLSDPMPCFPVTSIEELNRMKRRILQEVENEKVSDEMYSSSYIEWRDKFFVKDRKIYDYISNQGVRFTRENLHERFEKAMNESPFNHTFNPNNDEPKR